MNAVALPTTVADIIAEYTAKEADVEQAIAGFERAYEALGMSATVQGVFVDNVGGSRPYLHASNLRANLLKSGWRAVYNRLQIDSIASAKDKKLFDQALASPPPLTMENTKATFGDYLIRPRFHILKGLAEVFTSLDPAYKSHTKVRVGAKGLPKRVIINWGDGHGYGFDRFRDMVNAMAALRGQPPFEWGERNAIQAMHAMGEDAVLDGRKFVQPARRQYQRDEHHQTIDRGLTVRRFANGNAHVFFDRDALVAINKALAEFYGEVLPDAEPEGVKPSASTAVSKDLQFYWTPHEVAEAALDFADISHPRHYRGDMPPMRVLEPSCGDGRILDVIREYGRGAFGIEYHPGRASQARAKGHVVLTANFLEHPATPEFDAVVMNPPFYGKHYVKHVRHAIEFLRPGGTLVSILPATARYDHGELQGEWRDLPVASFAEAGTNVPTTMLKMRRAK